MRFAQALIVAFALASGAIGCLAWATAPNDSTSHAQRPLPPPPRPRPAK